MEKTNYKITKPIRLIELFGGVGSQAMALRNIGANFEHYRLIEFDKYPVASYNAIHGTDFKPTDITKISASDLGIVDTNKYEYIMTYSFPCQDLSIAGQLKGMAKGSGTRSGLLWEVERLLNECEEFPQVLLMENVPLVIGKKNIKDFEQWQLFLKSKGYSNFVKILNSKDFGNPQGRRRCFMVSILGDYNYEFPEGEPLILRMEDLLEDEVDKKYYLFGEYDYKPPLEYSETDKLIEVGKLKGGKWDKINESCRRLYSPKGIAPTLNTCNGGNHETKILIEETE